MTIPEEAIEAAAKAIGDEFGWIPNKRDRELVTIALEAAAPIIAAHAWEEGQRTGSSRAMRHMSDEPSLPLKADNPYRVHMPRSAITGRYKTKGDQK